MYCFVRHTLGCVECIFSARCFRERARDTRKEADDG